MRLIKVWFSKAVTLVSGSEFEVDSRVPLGRIIFIVLDMFSGILRYQYKLRRVGFGFVGKETSILSPSLITVEGTLKIGKRCTIDALSLDGVKVGRSVSIGNNTKIECTGNYRKLGQGISIGNFVSLGSDNFFGCVGGIEIGNDTIFGNYCSLHSESHNYSNSTIPIRLQGVKSTGIKIGRNCWIGAKTTILDGVVLEDNIIVAAGAVITRGTYPANSIIGGVPAKVIKIR